MVLQPGDLVKIQGLRGVWTFHKVNKDGSLECFGGTFNHERWRSFRPERVTSAAKRSTNPRSRRG